MSLPGWLVELNREVVACERCPRLVEHCREVARTRVVVALGKIGFDAYLAYLKRRGFAVRKADYVFAHGARYAMPDGRVLLASYHPSLQNTNTGKLTRAMFARIFREARKVAE